MRFFRRRRTQVRAAPTPAVVHSTTAGPIGRSNAQFTVEWKPIDPPQPEEPPVPELTPRERKLYRVTTKREQRTAGQLAVRAGLAATDGSGRGVVRDLNALVKAGKLTRHKGRDRSTYTRAA